MVSVVAEVVAIDRASLLLNCSHDSMHVFVYKWHSCPDAQLDADVSRFIIQYNDLGSDSAMQASTVTWVGNVQHGSVFMTLCLSLAWLCDLKTNTLYL